MADAGEVLDDRSYTELKELVEAGEVGDLSVEEEYAVRRKMVEEQYDDLRDDIDEYRRDKNLRGFDKKVKKRSYRNRAGRYGAGIGSGVGGVVAFQTLGVAGSVLAWPMVAGAAVAGGAGAGLAAYYGMGRVADRVIEGRNTYVEKRADTKERWVAVRESLDKATLDVKEKKDAGLERVRSFLSREDEESA